jgi:DNA-binding transcriptional LysR family regulator
MADIDLNLLPVFQALFEERRVGRAALRLNLSQSAVSHALGRLRHATGDDLFVRSPGGLEPTARALALAPVVSEALSRVRGALSVEAFDPAASDRCFRLAIGGYIAELIAPPLVTTAVARGARCRFDIWNKGADVLQLLDSRVLDAAIGSFGELPARYCSLSVLHEYAVWVARKDHPQAFAATTIDQLLHLRRVRLTAGTAELDRTQVWSGASGRLAINTDAPPPVAEVFQTRAAMEIVARSDMVALVPSRIAREMGEALGVSVLPAITPPPFADVRLVWARINDHEPGLSWLRDLVIEVAHGVEAS